MTRTLNPASEETGFTLLERLLVVAILSSLALVATVFVDTRDSQERFEETRSRLEIIRRAVLGNLHLTSTGQPIIGGFVADMGRLPNNLEELLSEPTDCNPDQAGDQPCPLGGSMQEADCGRAGAAPIWRF